VNTVIRLKDGETNLLAGLIRRDERRSLRGVPGIIKIPFLRDLFASNDKALQEKDIVFTITPHILRTPNITEEDLSPIWIGTEDDIRLKSAPPISVFERQDVKDDAMQRLQTGSETKPETVRETEQETTEKPVEAPPPEMKPEANGATQPQMEPQTQQENQQPVLAQNERPAAAGVVQPVNPPAAEQTTEAPEAGNAVVSFASPNVNPKLDTDIILHVRLENAPNAGSVFLFFNFDPAAVEVKDVLQGAMMSPGAFAKSFDNARGTININANHAAAGERSGIIATVVLHSLKPGQTTINLNSAVIRDAAAHVIPVTFLPYTLTIQ
jgi:general secretion pathway protein D